MLINFYPFCKLFSTFWNCHHQTAYNCLTMKQILPYFWFFVFTQNIVCMPVVEIDDVGDLETDVEYGDRFEGDMELNDEQLAAILGDRNVLVGENYRWPNNTIPYVMSENHTSEQINSILLAMREIEDVACVRFQRRRNQTDYVQFEVCYFRIFL